MPAVPDLLAPDILVPLSFVGVAIAIVLVLWRLHARAAKLAHRRRWAGYRLIDCLKAYSAWIDWHREEPLLRQSAAELGLPEPLAQAVQIKDEHFPQLGPLLLQLLHSHRELMEYLWEENILRLTHAAPRRPHYADPRYHQLRDRQDAALDSLFLQCRQLIGDDESGWRQTQSDFSFSSGMNQAPSTPSS
jgi:hypothetical protein